MKQIQGTSYNIEDDIVGRITFGKGNLFGRSNNILFVMIRINPHSVI